VWIVRLIAAIPMTFLTFALPAIDAHIVYIIGSETLGSWGSPREV
jgi:hypothetical protein